LVVGMVVLVWWLWGWCLRVRGTKDEMGVVVVGLVFERKGKKG
jgi:hypothetical protein